MSAINASIGLLHVHNISNSITSQKARKVALISIFLAHSQTLVYTAKPRIRG